MIRSIFVLNILDLLLDHDEPGMAIRPQIDHLTDGVYDYTGVGVFITFYGDENILKYAVNEDIVLDGVKITSPELALGASATLFLKGGIINYLEIRSYDGAYPKKELSVYTLQQEGNWAARREKTPGGI